MVKRWHDLQLLKWKGVIMDKIISASFFTFTLVFASAALSDDLTTCKKSHSILDSFRDAEAYLRRESLKTSSLPNLFLTRPDGTRYIPDSTKERFLKESTYIALSVTTAPVTKGATLVRYLAVGDNGKVIRGFTSLAKAVEFFKSKKFTTSFHLIGAKSGGFYAYWNALYKNWQFSPASDSVVSKIGKLYGETRDPLVAVPNILVDFESRPPRFQF
jgi:hypothetical protein